MTRAGEQLEVVAEESGGVCARVQAKVVQGPSGIFNAGGDV